MKTHELTYHLSKTQFNNGYIENTYTLSSNGDCQILGLNFDDSDIDKMVVDGNIQTLPSSHFIYLSAGTHTVRFYFKKFLTARNLFMDCRTLTTSNWYNMNDFYCDSLTSLYHNCTAITTINLNNFEGKNVTQMINSFNSCNKLTSLNISSLRPHKLTDVRNLFNYSISITTIDLRSIDFSNVLLWGNTFANCPKLTSIYMNSPINSSATYTTNMFINSTASGAKLYYNSNYNYSYINNVKGSNWTLTPYNF